MCNLSWTPHSNLEKDNSLKTTRVLAQRWAVWSILTKNYTQSVGALTIPWSYILSIRHCYDFAVHSFHVTRNNIRPQRDSRETMSIPAKSAMAKSVVVPFVIYGVAFLMRILV